MESNPILTEISDSMTGEGRCLEEKDEAGKAAFAARKEKANTDLQVSFVW